MISVRWVTTPTAPRSFCRSRSRTSAPPRKTDPTLRLDRARHQRGQRRLARARPAHERDRLSGGHRQVDALSARTCPRRRRRSGRAARARAARPARSSPPSGSGSTASIWRMRSTAPKPSWMSGRWCTRLSICPTNIAVTRNSVTSCCTDRPPPDGHHRAGDGRPGQQCVHDQAGAPEQALLDAHDRAELLVHDRGELRDPADGERLPQAGAQVVPGGDGLLEGGGMVGPRGLLDHLAARDLAEQRPGEHGDDRRPAPGTGARPATR